jgi:hemerythrin
MSFITWSDELSVDIEEIDQQHKNLIDIINKMDELVKMGSKAERSHIRKIFAELVDYTSYHFKAEEELFQAYHYPGWEEHKKQHNDLAMQLLKLQISFAKGETDVSQEMMNFLNKWLVDHILVSDKEYAKFLKKKGVS